jgi:acyl-[acyl carrier protein]--UDP-N-acetylglucosamine O-acyltransferase
MIHETAIVNAPPCVYARGEGGERTLKDIPLHGVDFPEDCDVLALAIVVSGTERPTKLGNGCRILHRAHVGHDCVIGEHVVVGAGSLVAGFAEIGDRTELKIGVLVRNRVKIGKDCIIGMGAIIVKDVPDNMIVYGIPPNQTMVDRSTGMPRGV